MRRGCGVRSARGFDHDRAGVQVGLIVQLAQNSLIQQEGIIGAITGRAIYEGTLDFTAAQALADQLSGR